MSAGVELVTERRYDAHDGQLAIAHLKQTSTGASLIAGQAITRGQSGVVSRIDTFGSTAGFSAGTGQFNGSPNRVQTFGYDANARLTKENDYKDTELTAWLADGSKPATIATAYGYDQVGNRLSKTVVTPAGTESTRYTYDNSDRLINEVLTTAGGSTITTGYTWASNGNLASKTTPSEYTAYLFDSENRLIDVKRGASVDAAVSIAKYGYDADGRRVHKATQEKTTKYLIDSTTGWPQVVLETATSIGGAVDMTAYVWGIELRQQTRGGQGTLFGSPSDQIALLAGHLNTPLAAISRSGDSLEEYDSSAFGEPANSAPLAPHQFTGEYWDHDSRLIYLRARWLQPNVGRFVSSDPVQATETNPRSANRYVYANSDPVNAFDPSGLMTLGELQTVIKNQVRAGVAAGSQGIRVTPHKFGCMAIEAVVEEAITHGIYIIIDELSGGKPYVGKTKNELKKRVKQHAYAETKRAGPIFSRIKVVGNSGDLQIIEQLIYYILLEMVGGDKGKLSNKDLPLSPDRPEKGKLRSRLAAIKLCK